MEKITVDELVEALYLDLKESYSSLTREWLKAEAEKQLAGASPTGGPGMFLKNYLEKADLLPS
ncbi:hypothetical protein LCGC14_1253250 [marine sediment metagenome]|uniref:Uncharacterized protein n=1 Tax=marine sediment metagenome TaxID=412755 RepID=A0A0F9LP42_9ZZZZ